MPKIIGVRFRRAGKVYYFDPTGFEDLETGDYVIVETTRGVEAGRVIVPPTEIPAEEAPGVLKPIQRRADWRDLTRMERYRLQESQALATAREKVTQHGLPMKLVRAEYNFDGSHLTIFFTAEKRIDFRELVRDLAKTLRTRIELRQVGVRDEAKLLDGYGRCGRRLCCSSWLSDFTPVSIRMAKQQDLPLSPAEISGLCGRLLCCLTYENEYYTAVKSRLPQIGERVRTPHGPGKVTGLNVIRETVTVELDSKATVEVAASTLRKGKERGHASRR
ncbi:MAG: stage 0 sporulation family protein [Anaerolineae bacterium]